MRTVIAIDPAASTGVATFNNEELHSVEVIKSPPASNIGERFINYQLVLRDLFAKHSNPVIVYEDYFFSSKNRQGSAVNVMFRVCISATAYENGLRTHVAPIGGWKKNLTGRGNAQKPLIKQSVNEMFEIPEKCPVLGMDKMMKTPQDVFDAVGIGKWLIDLGELDVSKLF